MRESGARKAARQLSQDIENAHVIRKLGGFPLPLPETRVGQALRRLLRREQDSYKSS